MKRSQMIKEIDKELFRIKCMDEDPNGTRLLDFIESLGMLPPDTLANALSLTDKDWKVERDEYIYNRFKWESEER